MNKLASVILDGNFIKLSVTRRELDDHMASQGIKFPHYAGSVADSIGLGTTGLSRNKDYYDSLETFDMPGKIEKATDVTAALRILRQSVPSVARSRAYFPRPHIASRDPADHMYAVYNPMNYATMENLSRAAILGGAAGGTYLGGRSPRAAAIASAGALGGGMVGGYVGKGIGAAIDAYKGYIPDENDPSPQSLRALQTDQRLMSGFGALGGLTGGLAAGKYLA